MQKIATNSFELTLAGTWRIETLKNPATLVGPKGEILMINSVVISSGTSEGDFESVRQALQQNAEDSMQNAASDPQLRITIPLKKEQVKGGPLSAEMLCHTLDGTKYFFEFSIAGPSTLVFATLEGPATAEEEIASVRDSLKKIAWLPKR